MGTRLRSGRQKKQQHPIRLAIIITAGIFGIALIVVVVLGYWLNWHWTGLVPEASEPKQHAKALWDWLNLLGVLAIPVVVGLGAAWYTAQQGKVSHRENKDNQRQAALQAYIDKISELLLKEHLGELTADGKLKPEYEQVRKIARVRTITVLFQLDARRIGYVFTFLRENGLTSDEPNSGIISLSGANLSIIDLSQTNIRGVNLSGANLRGANLSNASLVRAELTGANLDKANLSNTNLSFANLNGASLLEANLSGVNLWHANVVKAKFSGANLSNANLSDSNLSQADFTETIIKEMNGADFIDSRYGEANLSGANLSKANLRNASFTPEQLNKAKSLEGATMLNGSKHP